VFRSGEHRPVEQGNELDRIILYLPVRLLDLAESLAEKAGAATIQEYCSGLLAQAIENERARQRVEQLEANRGPLQGLKEVADDPDYLAEWQMRSESRQDRGPAGGAESGQARSSLPRPTEEVAVDPGVPTVENQPDESHPEAGPVEASAERPPAEPPTASGERSAIPVAIPGLSLKPTVLLMSDQTAMDVLARHVGWSQDDWGFLTCLRRGDRVPAPKVSELTGTLTRLEEELRDAELIDRRMAHALHRLALESQVLLTDAWPGVFDERVVRDIRLVQEQVERILSGQDIRYYPADTEHESERPH
jgi:hypothetical protein